jgi:uncharacterized repeat protein (TIGR03943 family)
VVEIENKDYAIFYRDIAENPHEWDGKTVSFLALVAKDKDFQKNTLLLGRHVMTCCADDIKYLSLAAETSAAENFKSYDWVRVRARVAIKFNRLYKSKGPVFLVEEITLSEKPAEPVATFY